MPHAALPNASPGGHIRPASTKAMGRAPLGDAPHASAGQRSIASSEGSGCAPAGAPQAGAGGQLVRASDEAIECAPLAPAAILGRLAFAASVLVVLAAPAGLVKAEPIASGAIRVIDGDTIAVGRDHYRLVGFDAPELHGRGDACPEARARAQAAAGRLATIVAGGGLDLAEVPCACAPRTVGTRLCNYKRRCGVLTARGEDVGRILIAEGLAQPFPYNLRRPARAPKWCGR